MTLAGYLSVFRGREADLLGRGEPTGHVKTVATTWKLAFAKLKKSAPGAAALLRLLAFCAPEAIPLRLLLQPRLELTAQLPSSPGASGAGAAAGRRAGGRGCCRRTAPACTDQPGRRGIGAGAPAGPDGNRRQMPAKLEKVWKRAAAAVIEAALPADPRAPGNLAGVRIAAATCPGCPHDITAGVCGELRPILGRAGATRLPGISSRGCLIHRCGCWAPSTGTPCAPASSLARWTGRGGGCGQRPGPVRRAPGGARAGSRRGALLYPDRPRRPRLSWTGEAGDAAGARSRPMRHPRPRAWRRWPAAAPRARAACPARGGHACK